MGQVTLGKQNRTKIDKQGYTDAEQQHAECDANPEARLRNDAGVGLEYKLLPSSPN